MKMRLSAFLAFALLSISILSYGVTGPVFADSHDIPPVSVSTNAQVYSNGHDVTISGNVRDFDSSVHSGQALTYIVITPDGLGRVAIGQIIPNSDGSYQDTFKAGGPLWKLSGDYVVEVNFAGNKGTATLNYVGGSSVVTPPSCASNETLVNGVCVVNQPPPPPTTPTCSANETLINGVCVENEPEPIPTCSANETLINGVCVENEPEPVDKDPVCGTGTILKDGQCVVDTTKTTEKPGENGSCLIATAAYGTELAPQVQFLREVRDNTVLSTASGTAFMTGFNTIYYSFAPTVADWERENPMFQEAVRAFITPMISTLSIMSLADGGSETEVLGLGISVIALNLGMYIAAPAIVGFKVHKHIKSRK